MRSKSKRVPQIVRLVYYNFGDGSDQEKLEDLEEAWALDADVIGLSEHADRVDVTAKFVDRHPEFEVYYGDGRSGAAKECLIWRKSLGKDTLKKSITLVKARRVPAGAGPENPGAKVANRVRLRVNGRRVHLIIAHQYATVNNRREAAWLFMNALMDVVRSRRGTVFFFGDLNAEPGHALVQALRALFTGSSAPRSGDTHKRRLIDYVMVKGAKIVSAFTKKLTSDHKMLVVDVRL